MPFASFLHADLQLQSVILALIAELPETTETASVLSELFPDPESLEPETRDRLRQILKEWQGLVVTDASQPNVDGNVAEAGSNADQVTTLAGVYRAKVYDHKRRLDKTQQAFGAYEEKLFISSNTNAEDLLVGSRLYECQMDFLLCLDTFYSISFGSCIESEGTRPPLIDAFRSEVYQAQLELLPPKVIKKQKFGQDVGTRCTPWMNSTTGKKSDIAENALCCTIISPRSKHARSRSHSASETDLNVGWNSRVTLQRVLSQPADFDVSASKTGLDVISAAGLCDADVDMENTNNNNSSGLQLNSDSSVDPGLSASICSVDSMSKTDCIKPARADFLSESVLPPSTVERLKVDGQLAEIERVGEWMRNWAAQHHAEDNRARSSAMRVRVSPQLLAYSLWLIDSCRHFTPHVDDVTVAMVHGHTSSSVPREPSRPSAEVNNDSVRDENVSVRRDFQSSAGSTNSVIRSQETVPKDFDKISKKGRRSKKSKLVRSDEVTDGVNQRQARSLEAQIVSSHPQLTELTNRSANNNADRFDDFFCKISKLCCLYL